MLRVLVFLVVLLIAAIYAARRGGGPERLAAALLVGAATLSLVSSLTPHTFVRPVPEILTIDVALFVGLLVIALRANRFWPLWIAAMQLVTLGVHGVRAYDEDILPIVYSRLVGEIAYPVCLALLLGTYHYQRRTRIDGSAPRDWSPFRW